MWRAVSTVLWKDLKIEFRTREALSASVVFSILILVIFNFTMELDAEESRRLGSGLLWIAFAFAGVLSLNRSFALEREENCAQGMLLAPIDRTAIFLGKFLANLIFMLLTGAFVLPLFFVFFNIGVGEKIWLLALIVILGTVGFASAGTLFSAIAVQTRMREVLLPILLFPVSVPVLIAAVETTSYVLGVQEEVSFWFKLLIVYDVIFMAASLMMFEYILQE